MLQDRIGREVLPRGTEELRDVYMRARGSIVKKYKELCIFVKGTLVELTPGLVVQNPPKNFKMAVFFCLRC